MIHCCSEQVTPELSNFVLEKKISYALTSLCQTALVFLDYFWTKATDMEAQLTAINATHSVMFLKIEYLLRTLLIKHISFHCIIKYSYRIKSIKVSSKSWSKTFISLVCFLLYRINLLNQIDWVPYWKWALNKVPHIQISPFTERKPCWTKNVQINLCHLCMIYKEKNGLYIKTKLHDILARAETILLLSRLSHKYTTYRLK